MIQDCRDIMYMRCAVPENAVSLKARVWILGDAAEGIMVAAYVGFELPGRRWSCTNVLGKSLLAPESWTIPKKELQGLTTASNVKVVIERALDGWIDTIMIGCDSEIALAWCIYENVKLNVFHRNRVNNIRAKISLDQLFHVQGPENCADIGHRYIKNKKTFNVSPKKFPLEDFFPIFLAQTPLIYTFLLIFKLQFFNTE